MNRFWNEVLDQFAHGAAALGLLVVTELLGTYYSPAAALLVAWTLGFVREFTEWQDGGAHPFTPRGLLDQSGWIAGGVVYVLSRL